MNPIQTVLAVGLWTCATLVVYAYVLYPPIIWACSRCFGRRSGDAPEDDGHDLPFLSLLIAAHDEEAVIERRLRNALAMDYPRDRFEVVVGSDGSTDATARIVRGFADDGVRLLDYRQRRGKAAVINAAVPELRGEIVLLSDANTDLDPDAPRRLVRWFRRPEVGVVCGRLILTDPRTGRNADGLYWRYETFLKCCEGRLGALLGANGSIYAMRRELYRPIQDGTIIDDFVIPLLARSRSRCEIVYERGAVAREETPPDVRSEFRRRSRIGAGDFQSLALLWRLLDPRNGWVAFAFLSHKVLRWTCPFFLLGALATGLALALGGVRPYAAVLQAQLAFYAVAAAMAFVPGRFRLLRPLRLATMFTSMNAALLVGFWRWLRGTQGGAWQRTVRLAEVDGGS